MTHAVQVIAGILLLLYASRDRLLLSKPRGMARSLTAVAPATVTDSVHSLTRFTTFQQFVSVQPLCAVPRMPCAQA